MLGSVNPTLTSTYLLQRIFSHFSPGELASTLSVCKIWKETLSQNDFWKPYFDPGYDLPDSMTYKEAVTKLKPKDISKATVDSLCREFSLFIQSLSLGQKAQFSCRIVNQNQSLDFFFGASDELQTAARLEQENCPIAFQQTHWLYLKNFQEVNFIDNKNENMEVIEIDTPNYAFMIRQNDIDRIDPLACFHLEEMVKKTEKIWFEYADNLVPDTSIEWGAILFFFFTYPFLRG